MKKNIVSVLTLILIIGVLFMIFTAQTPYQISTNLQVKGWLFGTSTLRGERTWATAGAEDTIVVSGVDTNCYVLLQPDTSIIGILRLKSLVDDTIFVTSDSSEQAGDIYNYFILR